MPRPSPYSEEVAATIIAEYKGGRSMHELARIYGGDRATVRRRLAAAGVEMRTREERQKKLPFRDNAFASAETDAEAAYWTGMLMSDGCISEGKHSTSIILALSQLDHAHVEAFRRFLGATNKITISPMRKKLDGTDGGNASRMVVASRRTAADLARYGVVPKKSKTASVSHLQDNRHFWRGVVDGDGSLGWRTLRAETHTPAPLLQVCGSEMLMRQMAEFARGVTGTTAEARPAKGCWGFALHAGAAAEMVSHLYTDCAIALDRKWKIAHEILCHHGLCGPGRIISTRRAAH